MLFMFERYTEGARRVIFFARFEASECGSSFIETEHLLLGVIREDKTFLSSLLSPEDRENIRAAVALRDKNSIKTSTSVDIPLSEECKQILGNAAVQAEQRSDRHIGIEHLLLGLLSQKSFASELLTQRGVTAEKVLQSLKKSPSAERPKTERRKTSPPSSPPWAWPDAT